MTNPVLVDELENLSFAGRFQIVESHPTVLVCGHLAGTVLFGGERSLVDLLDGFIAIHFNTIVVLPNPVNNKYLEAILARTVQVYTFAIPLRNACNDLNEIVILKFERLINSHRINAVHANTITLREPLIAARRCKIPAIVHAREIVSHDPDLCRWMGTTPEAITESILEEADYIIANSCATATCFPTLGRTSIVPNCVDLSDFIVDRHETNTPVRVALIGNTSIRKKGINNFIEVARLLENKTHRLSLS
ncbi:MAG: glycosyltransferase [Methylococcales bacterium]